MDRRSLLAVVAGLMLSGLSVACDHEPQAVAPRGEEAIPQDRPARPAGPVGGISTGGPAEGSGQSDLWQGPAAIDGPPVDVGLPIDVRGPITATRLPGTDLDSSGGTGPGYRPSADAPAGTVRPSTPSPR